MLVPISSIKQNGRLYVDAADYAAFLENAVRESEDMDAHRADGIISVAEALRKLAVENT